MYLVAGIQNRMILLRCFLHVIVVVNQEIYQNQLKGERFSYQNIIDLLLSQMWCIIAKLTKNKAVLGCYSFVFFVESLNFTRHGSTRVCAK